MFKKIAMLLMVFLLLIPNFRVAEAAKISNKSYSLMLNETVKISVVDTSKTVKWSSSNKKVATVDKKGNIKAKSAGKAVIIGKIGKKSYTCNVTVSKSVNAILMGHGTTTDTPTDPTSPGTTSPVSLDKYNSISSGSYSDVKNIIGGEGVITSSGKDEKGAYHELYTWYGEDNSYINVLFIDGKYSDKAQENLK
jgi:hypothetical protein